MPAPRDIMTPSRGMFALGVLVAATALVVLNRLSGDAWVKLVMVLAGLLLHEAALAAPAPEAAP